MGSRRQIKAVRRSLKQHGLMDEAETDAWPLNGHWETEHGATVVVEGKIVRWSSKRASKLCFTKEDRSACTLVLYGEATHGRLVTPPFASYVGKMLRWDNGDVWRSCYGHTIGEETLLSQTMTKTSHDTAEDALCLARSKARVLSVSKEALGLPFVLEDKLTQFLGSDLYYVRVHFTSNWNPSLADAEAFSSLEAEADFCESISQRHPRVGLRHCWADKGTDCCGQRTLVNGEEVDEDSFSRHIGVVC